jgi:hypothetical protein
LIICYGARQVLAKRLLDIRANLLLFDQPGLAGSPPTPAASPPAPPPQDAPPPAPPPPPAVGAEDPPPPVDAAGAAAAAEAGVGAAGAGAGEAAGAGGAAGAEEAGADGLDGRLKACSPLLGVGWQVSELRVGVLRGDDYLQRVRAKCRECERRADALGRWRAARRAASVGQRSALLSVA